MVSYIHDDVMALMDEHPKTASDICEILYPNLSSCERKDRMNHIYKTLWMAYKHGLVQRYKEYIDGRGVTSYWYSKDAHIEHTPRADTLKELVRSALDTEEYIPTNAVARKVFGPDYTQTQRERIYKALRRFERKRVVESDPEYNYGGEKRWRLKK